MNIRCMSCGATFRGDDAVKCETEIPCPCGCGNNLELLLCPYCSSDDLMLVRDN
jgi:DNA-directed RNA polymerase subunit RPC12/RpoP